MTVLGSFIQKLLGKTDQTATSSNLDHKSESLTFTIDPKNSNRAIGSDNITTLSIEYNSPSSNYIQYIGSYEKVSLFFDNHHNGSCSIFFDKNQNLSQVTINSIKSALFVLGFKGSISFNIL